MKRPTAGLRAALALALLSSSAWAQDVDPFDPAASNASGDGGLGVESPFLPGDGFLFGVYTTIAEDTAVLYRSDGTEVALASQMVGTTLHGGYTFGVARVDLLLPLYPWVDAPSTGFNGVAIGDVRLQGTVPLIESGTSFTLALVPRLALPTGTIKALTHRGFHGGVTVALGGQTPGSIDWTANLGLTASQQNPLREVALGSSFDLGGSVVYRLDDQFRFGGEVDFSYGFPWADREANPRSTAHLFARSVNPDGIGLTAGVGTGLLPGVGAPEYRLFLGLGYAPPGASGPRDRDNDGLPDDIDRCPDDPEDIDEYEDTDGCPEFDNDADGLLDVDDACPMEPEDPDGFEDEDGCPDPDNDADTVLDGKDKCPLVPGLVENEGCPDGDRDDDGLADSVDECPDEAGPERTNGCPDRDEDRVPDFRDKCPDDPIPADEDPAQSDGCPKRVYITEAKIVITEKVYFESGKAVIKPASFALLDDVAALINSTERIGKVEVQGHTDSQGSDSFNLKLSNDRAIAVREYLVTKGKVAPDRLTAKGYGEKEPIDTNRTDTGRSRNRRVEFKILEQTTGAVTKPAPAPAAPSPKPVTKPAPAPAPKPDVSKPAPDDDPWEDLPEPTGSPWDEN